MLNTFTVMVAQGMLFVMDNTGRIVGWFISGAAFMLILGAAMV